MICLSTAIKPLYLKRNTEMAKYIAKIKNQDGSFYALVVRIDADGQESVVSGFRGFYKTVEAAERATTRFIAKC